MAIRHEDLLVREAVVYRFPTHMARTRRARARLVRRRRALAALVTVVFAGGMLLATGPEGVATAGAERSAPRTVSIRPGDTLWGVAARFAPEGSDLRAYVAALDELNGIEGPIHPGMRLKLPR